MFTNFKSIVCVVLFLVSIGAQSKKLKISSGLKWSNCGPPTDPIKLTYLDVTPFPLTIPGIETLSAIVNIARNISSPVEASVTIKKHSFLGWIEIPCVDNIGSCHYDDLCALSPYNDQCPTVFKKLQLPCACPVNEGMYSVKKYPVNIAKIGPHWLEHGMYKGQVTLTSNSVELGCIAFQAALK
ncbi:ganglioside GM2 activator-like [Ischnura elegans]|uniref:ganglioside GM2 activator-like n=1 Tax=Ischnura elegans TaxID=197161 RepID=UPI001ED88E4B|nr:ganglioside GM2 activator-like [Ischnura elegans]